MKEECLNIFEHVLNKDHAVFVDGTLGLGGHTIFLLENFPSIKVIGIDRDRDALKIATERINKVINKQGDSSQFLTFHGNYAQIATALKNSNQTGADAILLDLGVSSMQLDNSDRGFSYTKTSDIDMRMNQNDGINAKDYIIQNSEEVLTTTIKQYGEERYAKSIASNLKKLCSEGKLNTTAELADAIRNALPSKIRHDKQAGTSSIKRVFQALRIAVNNELESLKDALSECLKVLNKGGVIIVLSYHSLEDRLVKNTFLKAVGEKTDVELGLPFSPQGTSNDTAIYEFVVRGSKKASLSEVEMNSRAKSVRLRSIKRVK